MARNKNNSSDIENGARIKVVYFEAENVSNDLTGVINALAGAIRTAPVQVIPHQPTPPQIEKRKAEINGNGQTAVSTDNSDDNIIEGEVTAPAQDKQVRDKKPFKGNILDDIPWDGNGTPFVEYVKHKNPQDSTKKYLVIAAWFKRHGGHDAIGSNLIYNAYRKLGWTSLTDISQPLRDGTKSERGYYRSEGKGNYGITGIGLDAADKVGSEKAESGS